MYNANLDMCTWTFAKTLARKNFLSPFQKKTLAETVNCIPKGLRKGNPFQGPFAQLSYISWLRGYYNLHQPTSTMIFFGFGASVIWFRTPRKKYTAVTEMEKNNWRITKSTTHQVTAIATTTNRLISSCTLHWNVFLFYTHVALLPGLSLVLASAGANKQWWGHTKRHLAISKTDWIKGIAQYMKYRRLQSVFTALQSQLWPKKNLQ